MKPNIENITRRHNGTLERWSPQAKHESVRREHFLDDSKLPVLKDGLCRPASLKYLEMKKNEKEFLYYFLQN